MSTRCHFGSAHRDGLIATEPFSDTVKREQKLERLAQAMKLAHQEDIGPEIKTMSAKLDLPDGLGRLGISVDLYPRIIKNALADHSHKTNPRVASADDYAEILRKSM